MAHTRKVSRPFKSDEIRKISSLSYGLDSEEDEISLSHECSRTSYELNSEEDEASLTHAPIQILKKQEEELPKYLSVLLFPDAWINWKAHLLLHDLKLWFLLFLILAVSSGFIIGSSLLHPLCQLEVKEIEGNKLHALGSSDKINEMEISNHYKNEDIYESSTKNKSFTTKLNGSDKEISLNPLQMQQGDEFNFSSSHSSILRIVRYRKECSKSPALQRATVLTKKTEDVRYKRPISNDNRLNQNDELHSKLIELEKKIQQLTSSLGHLQMDFFYKILEYQQSLPEENKIRKTVQEEINLIEKEKLGKADFALENSGGSIVSTPNTKTYTSRTAIQLFGFPLWLVESSPRNAIQASVGPGECWTFHGSVGNLRINLAAPAILSSFSLYHIPKQISMTGEIESAPREFSVIGFHNSYELDNEILLGEYEYDANGPPQQTFLIQREATKPFNIVELRIHSNYGNKEFTCIYRFQVHGKFSKL